MTLKIPKPGIGDLIIKLLGKKRGVFLAPAESEKYGPYTSSVAKKESFLKAFLRPANEPLPDGMVDIFSFVSQKNYLDEE